MANYKDPVNRVDAQYLKVLDRLLTEGVVKKNRTGIDTISVFGEMMRFNLQDGFPLVTTKKMWFKGIWYELYWMMGLHMNDPKYQRYGLTNIYFLVKNDVHIWTDWGVEKYMKFCGIEKPAKNTAEWGVFEKLYIEKMKSHDEEFITQHGDLGDIYGKHWRQWETCVGGFDADKNIAEQAEQNLQKDYSLYETEIATSDKGNSVLQIRYDQLQGVINDLRTNPDSRRIKITAWEPIRFRAGLAALPCCHHDITFQSIEEDGIRKLNCSFKMRSSDFMVAGNWNTAFYAILTHLIAVMTDHIPNELIYYADDVHLYSNLIEQAKQQMQAQSYELPMLEIDNIHHLCDIDIDSVRLVNYKHSPSIKCDVAL